MKIDNKVSKDNKINRFIKECCKDGSGGQVVHFLPCVCFSRFP